MARKNPYRYAVRRERHLFRRFTAAVLAVLVSAVLLITAVNYITAHSVTMETLRVTVAELPADLENWSILHVSDLHGVDLGGRQANVARALGSQNFSVCVMTGDMVGADRNPQPVLDLAALLPSDLPVLYLPGDEDADYLDPTAHGSVSPYSDWAETLTRAGITFLDRPVLFTRGKKAQARIWFIPESLYSLDLDAMERTWQAVLDALKTNISLTADEAARRRVAEYQLARIGEIRASLKEILDTDVQVTVTHTPLAGEYAGTLVQWSSRNDVFSIRRSALVLAGHYCAGQWRLPGVGPVYVPDFGWFPGDEPVTGFHYTSGIPQYISPGLGASGIYPVWESFRLFNSPAVTRIVLTSSIVQ